MPLTRHDFDRLVVRGNVFGSFSTMLVAAGRHPAMLNYLNQTESTKAAVNENYGRELLELHTVGLNYTEADVQGSAAILTGRTVDPASQAYVYDQTMHATGPVMVLGFSDPNPSAAGGEAVGDAYLGYLAHHQLTAQSLARKLCVHYVSDAPSPDLVAQVAAVYLASNTAILPTLHAIFCSDEFWLSRGAKVRRPADNLAASVRALGLQPSGDLQAVIEPLRWQMYLMGHSPLDCPTPNGYSDYAANWRSGGNLVSTWNMHRILTQNWWQSWSTFDPNTMLGGVAPATVGDALDAVSVMTVGQVLAASDRQTFLAYTGDLATTPYPQSAMKSMLSGVVTLLLDSPYFAIR